MNGEKLYEAMDAINDVYLEEAVGIAYIQRNTLSKRKMYLFILAATLMLGVLTACAAEVFQWENRLSEVLGLSDEQEQLVDGMWSGIQKTDTSGGITVTVHSVLADASTLYMLYDVKFPKGTDLSKNYDFEIQQIDELHWYGLGGSGTVTCSPNLVSTDEEAYTKTYLYTISNDEGDFREQKIRLWLKDIYYTDTDTVRCIAYKGEWVFNFDLRYSSNTIAYNVNKEVKGLYNRVKVEKLILSPLSIMLVSSSDHYKQADYEKRLFENDIVSAITLKDGTKITSEEGLGNSSLSVMVNGTLQYKAIFTEVIDPKQIESIEFYENESIKIDELQETDTTTYRSLSRRMREWFDLGIFVSVISFMLSAISILHFCKQNTMLQYEKERKKKAKKGKLYSYEKFADIHNKELKIYVMLCVMLCILYVQRIFWLGHLVLSNNFTTVTVFMFGVNILLVSILVITINNCVTKCNELNQKKVSN